jgi:hypothetical protein
MTLSDAAIRARAGAYCECKGICGDKHPRSRCRRGNTTGSTFQNLLILNGKQYCRLCAQKIKERML